MNILRNRKRFLYNGIITLVIMIIMLNTFNIIVYADEGTLDEAKKALENFYVGNIPEEALKANNISDMIKLIGDPYTEYFTEEDIEKLVNNVNMKFLGIGVYIDMTDQGARVTSVMVNSPALDAGIMEGDIIIKADDQLLAGLSLDEATPFINGKEEAEVNLSIRRNEKILEFKLKPRLILYPTVIGKLIDNNIAYIRILSFGNITFNEFGNIVKEFEKKNVNGYVIDIRNNIGGYIQTAIDIAGYFIGHNTAVILENKISNRFQIETANYGTVIDEPVIFLINGYSASASEILAAAVKDYNKGFFIGEKTYGKGTAQTVFNLSDGGVLKTTTLRFYSPKGNEINGVGIQPDFKVVDTDPLLMAQLLIGNSISSSSKNRFVKVGIGNKNFDVNLSNVKSKMEWEAYRLILNQATSYSMIDNVSNINEDIREVEIPRLSFVNMPRTQYRIGERISFDLYAPDYKKRIQYRAILWDEVTNAYYDLWNTADRYYNKWKPYGNEKFTLGFKPTRIGRYRIKIFAKRSDIPGDNAALKGMNCDCYIGEIPFIVTGS